ncbi:MAG: hypothetical protein WC140_04750 [Bacteroidales bacterium]
MAKYLQELLDIENSLNLTDYKVNGVSIWRLYRRYCRDKFLKKELSVIRYSKKKNYSVKIIVGIRHIFFSMFDIIKLFISHKTFENVIFPYPRLQKINNKYLDKFTDPVIKESLLSKNSCLCVFSFTKFFKKNRINKDLCYHVDLIYALSRMFMFFYSFFYPFTKGFKCVNSLFKQCSEIFSLNRKDLLRFHIIYMEFWLLMVMWTFLYKHINAKRLFIVVRNDFIPQIVAAHKLGIPVYEFQHGAVLGDTVLYTGNYDEIIDPDYMLTFGEIWRNSKFGIPINKIINIGWAYKSLIYKHMDNKIKKNYVLVISSPNITEKILSTTIDLAVAYPKYNFDIRCHPKESYNLKQINKVDSIKNLNIVDNLQEIFIALNSYKYVLGENSSVLYEAISIGKVVGRINYNGIKIRKISEADDEVFYYLKNIKDFEFFVNFFNPKILRDTYYSDFKPSIINNLL